MAENLNYAIDGSGCYKDDASSCKKWGRLYSREAAKGACLGMGGKWRLPTKGDWRRLDDYVGGDVAGKKLKAKSGWSKNGNGTDGYGFSGLPGGSRHDGNYGSAGNYGYWWSATEDGRGYTWMRGIDYQSDVMREGTYDESHGISWYSARCVEGSDREIGTELAAREERAPIATVTDTRDGQKYRTVKMGGATWMADNLNYVIDGSGCYGDDASNCKKHGRLYKWDAAMDACLGMGGKWRLPTREEWDDLVDYAGGAVAGKKLKSKSGWNRCNVGKYVCVANANGTDDYGFSALPGGTGFEGSGEAGNNSDFGNWWSATEYGSDRAYYLGTGQGMDGMEEGSQGPASKSWGHSVRCINAD